METTGFFKKIIFIGLILLLVSLTSALPSCTTTYSFVHISDTQNLATHYPYTYNFTFSYLESIKSQYNLSAIIITGDLVNIWDKKSEWDAYSHARNMTNIPLYVIAGNHDTNYGKNYKYYSQYTGEQKGNYVTALNDFDFVGINYVDTSLSLQEFTALRQAIFNRSHNFTIVATHYYMGKSGTLSTLGKDIDRQLIVQPTIILAGHIQGDLIRFKNIMIEKQTVVDRIETQANGIVAVRFLVNIVEDGVQIMQSPAGKYINPGDDYSQEDEKVKTICAVVHTDKVIADYKAAQNKDQL